MREAVRALLQNYEGNFLLVIHPGASNWSLPGGHKEENENIYDALNREIKEEFNFDIEILGNKIGITRDEISELPSPLSVYEVKYISKKHGPAHKLEYIFHAKIIGGKIKIQEEEIEQYKFFSKEEILNLDNTFEQIKKIIKII